MKILTSAAIILSPALAFGFSEIVPTPEERINVSALSEHILFIEATRVESKPARKEGGIEYRELLISGRILEVLRGDFTKKIFQHSCLDFRVWDENTYKKANGGEPSPDFLHGSATSVKTGAAEVKAGHRYVVIHFRENVFFVPVAANDMTWRDKILKFQVTDTNPKKGGP